MLKYFMQGRYPDLLIIFLPFNHAFGRGLSYYIGQMKTFKGLVDKYVPRTTKVFLIPAFKEFSSRYTKLKDHRINTLQRFEAIWLLNHALFGVTESNLLSPDTNRYGFLDLFTISEPLIDWSTDGVHFEPIWYELIMSMFWELYCNSATYSE
jgi:hypothetical protein